MGMWSNETNRPFFGETPGGGEDIPTSHPAALSLSISTAASCPFSRRKYSGVFGGG